ncbi:unnamed protein product [Victoria cruziana]
MAQESADPTLTLTSVIPSEGDTRHPPPSPSVPDSSPGSFPPDHSHAVDRMADDDPSFPEEPPSLSRNSSNSSLKKLNAEAPEFVPRASSASSLPSNCGTFIPQQQPIPRMSRVILQVHPVQIYPVQNSPCIIRAMGIHNFLDILLQESMRRLLPSLSLIQGTG